mmetsp:Transcript_30572/g.87744  ORF Transcript_30572/g.87744 Transcript_30572/m.87744 type:complete len:285 (+) Transcript_30572:46-900(+)
MLLAHCSKNHRAQLSDHLDRFRFVGRDGRHATLSGGVRLAARDGRRATLSGAVVGADDDGGVFVECLTIKPQPQALQLIRHHPTVRMVGVDDPPRALKAFLLGAVAAKDPHAVCARVEPILATHLPPKRLAIGCIACHQDVLSCATLLAIRRLDMQFRRLVQDRGNEDGRIINVLLTVQSSPSSSHLVWHHAFVRNLASDDALGILEVMFKLLVASDLPTTASAGVDSEDALLLLPYRLAIDALSGNQSVLSGTFLLTARCNQIDHRGLHTHGDGGVRPETLAF